MKRPWLLPALGFAGGILVMEGVPQWAPVLAVLAPSGFILTRWRSWTALYLLVGWGFAGGLAWWSERTPLGPWDLRLAADEPALEREIRGVVAEPPTLRLSERRGQTQARTTVSLRVDAWREPGQELSLIHI